MNPGARLPIDALAPEVAPGIRLLPVLHERVDLGSLARLVLDEVDPAAVAVELPTTLADAATRAVRRLPRLTVVLSEAPSEDALVWVVAPGDPIVEALRWAAERGRPTHHVDPDIAYRGRHHEPLPDPQVIWRLGPERYLEAVRTLLASAPREPADLLREKGMAHHLREAAARTEGTLLGLVGAAHAAGVAAALGGPTAPPLARQRRLSVELRHLHPESLTAVLPDLPLAHAVFESLRAGGEPEPAELAAAVSRRVELLTAGLRLISGEGADDARERQRAVVRLASRRGSRRVTDQRWVVDRARLGAVLWRVAEASYREQTREHTEGWQRRMFFDFARRYVRVQGQLVPGLYEWVVAARGVADDNLAWEVFDVARSYPWQEEEAELATARVDGDVLDLGTRRVRFRRRFFRVKQRPVLVPVRHRPRTDDPTEWLEAFTGDGICSYPPEDVVVEDYGRFLQQKALSNLATETSRTEPFVSSLLDGVDVRETLRNWHEQRVWVREIGRSAGDAGSVVVVFDDPADPAAYPYLMSWLGEHDQESDMALFATDPTQQIVGPGIMRATYGGFMLSYPPGRLFDVWRDPDYRFARSRAEVLVMAAVDYSEKKLVVHVAAHPPAARLKDYAARSGKRLLHIPLGSLSPVSLKKIRVVHILAGKHVRPVAKDYVW